MSVSSAPAERDLVERVAQDYRQRGYDVIQTPSPDRKPSFLGHIVPDLIAQKGDEKIVIEVKRVRTPRLPPSLRALLEALRTQPDWRLRLVYAGPEGELETFEVPTLTTEESQRQIDSAAHMYESGEQAVALLKLWSVFEAVGREQLAKMHHQDIGPMAPVAILKELTSFGLIEQDQYSELRNILELRNAAAHGQPNISVTRSRFEMLRELVKTLLYWQPVPDDSD
jgi:Holliday junction resolvase